MSKSKKKLFAALVSVEKSHLAKKILDIFDDETFASTPTTVIQNCTGLEKPIIEKIRFIIITEESDKSNTSKYVHSFFSLVFYIFFFRS